MNNQYKWQKKIGECHIAGDSTTLCGKPMLGNNYAYDDKDPFSGEPRELPKIDCKECLEEEIRISNLSKISTVDSFVSKIKATKEELQISLKKIGWRIQSSGNGLNDFIENSKGEKTSFAIRNNMLEIRSAIFGKTNLLGSVHIPLRSLTITEGNALGDPNKTIDFVTLDLNEKSFIMFNKD